MSGESLTVIQKVQGFDKVGSLIMDTELDGKLPSLNSNDTVVFLPYIHDYEQQGPGRIRGEGAVHYQLNDNPEMYIVSRTIEFESSSGSEVKRNLKLNAERVTTKYDEDHQLLQNDVMSTISVGSGNAVLLLFL